jgi:hypothetical protein
VQSPFWGVCGVDSDKAMPKRAEKESTRQVNVREPVSASFEKRLNGVG